MAKVSRQVICDLSQRKLPPDFTNWSVATWISIYVDFKNRGGLFESYNPFHFVYTTTGGTVVEYKLLQEL